MLLLTAGLIFLTVNCEDIQKFVSEHKMFETLGLFHLAALLRKADYMRDRKILGGHIYRKQA